MPSTIETAIAKIKGVGDHLCSAQVYAFDDYDPRTGGPTALCKRLGIPVTDDVEVEFLAKKTFSPIPASRAAKVAKQFKAILPDDYSRLSAEFGSFHLPGNIEFYLYSPEAALSVTRGAWWFGDLSKSPVLAISQYHLDCDGDSLGFLRSGNTFAPEVFRFKHELRHEGDVERCTVKLADSLSKFIISYLDALD